MTKHKLFNSKVITFIICAIAFFILEENFHILTALLLTFLIGLVSQFLLNRLTTKDDKKLPPLTREKEAYYHRKGLSDDDIKFFRETMMTTKTYILTIEKYMKKSSKLKAIEKRNNTVEISKALFKDIVNEPDRLHQVDQFLYVHLPSLSDLVEKFTNIENHKAKSKNTYDILYKSAVTIDKLAGEITNDYLKFKDPDLETMDSSIDLTELTIDRSIEDDEI